jgi:quercetin dioxygenase-like cupin family protein
MEIRRKEPTSKGTPDRFVGDVWVDSLVGGPDTHIRVSVVRFAPGARNAWHAHALGQTLHVTDGIGLTQQRGGDIVEIRAGDTVSASPGEWHWHGATPHDFMTHIAMWEAPAQGPESEWGDHIPDEEYAADR